LCAHEYFHLWNVKRIRPEALGPFDYSKENYTNLLWVAEGITSYYDELAMYRAGFRTEKDYLKILAETFSKTLNRKGGEVQSMHDASFNAWIKEYRPNENSINSSISYYLKGATLAALLDMELLSATEGKKGLDILMQYLYKTYYEGKNRGFSDDEFYKAIDQVAGKSLNFKAWAEGLNTSETNSKIAEILKRMGCEIENKSEEHASYTGINAKMVGGKLIVQSIEAQSPADGKDIQAGDELIAINSMRIKTDLDELVKTSEDGQLEILLSRAGLIRSIDIKAVVTPKLELSIIPKGENNLRSIWLRKK
jgi:predicted metalloprotease with PDZ domain